MAGRWSAEQVLALAPDASSSAAGRRLSGPAPWSDTGASADPAALWGNCAGSGAQPYQTMIDLSEPAFRCSCPSRKFPCKHALGLLLLWSSGAVADVAQPSGATTAWLAERTARARKAAARTSADPAGSGGPAGSDGPGPDAEPASGSAQASPRVADPAAARQRAQQRAARVAAGAQDLDQWLRDRIRTGLAGADRAGYGPTDQVAARLVDAQAPGLAGAVRRLGSVAASGEGWAGRLLSELALVRLLAAGHARLDVLPDDLAATIRSRIGYSTRTQDVLATRPVRDHWNVLTLRDEQEDRLVARRVQLRGAGTGRDAIVLSFSAGGAPLDASLVPGTCVDADLHFYPGALPLRAVVGTRHGEPGPLRELGGLSVAGAVAAWADALAADPWTTELPMVLTGVPVPPPAGGAGRWYLTDTRGDALELRHATMAGQGADGGDSTDQLEDGAWTLLAVSGGHPVTVAATFTPAGLRASAVRAGDVMVAL